VTSTLEHVGQESMAGKTCAPHAPQSDPAKITGSTDVNNVASTTSMLAWMLMFLPFELIRKAHKRLAKVRPGQ